MTASHLGLAAGIIHALAFIPYIISTLRGRSRPHRGSWAIWSVQGFVLFASYSALGASQTLWMPLTLFLGPSIIFLLSLRFGTAGWHSNMDRLCLLGALIGIVYLFVFQSPLTALIIGMMTDMLGALPTVVKAIRQPWTENAFSWLTAWLASLLNIAALQNFDFTLSAYPIYTALILTLITTPLVWYRLAHYRFR